MTVLCAHGHASESEDYCDTCGDPIATASPAPVASAPPVPAPSSMTCPTCGATAVAGALFCENCGYDFTTGTSSPPASSVDLSPAVVAPEVAAPVTSAAPAPSAVVATPSPATADLWVVEVWIDPDWSAIQESTDPMPSPGPPTLVVLTETSVLVGRHSVSRGIHPQVDCGPDSGVSRRHCQLTSDGQRWWVEDLQSSNGTYVGSVDTPLPTDPIPPGLRRELAEGDRIYLGAFTRLVLREALPGEA